ncbi:Inner centromere protein-related protein pic1 [Mycena venus]|uniref:Inner centromere protein-related protein pic1 n=1 Tax=Mycena venus TaxID=2733690 RepID=A0A8H6XSZ3_9AGAR|nr:Inner centromere protein-related protein pic1 [Mycena venus]
MDSSSSSSPQISAAPETQDEAQDEPAHGYKRTGSSATCNSDTTPFELPEIDSDSSDSDDEERLQAFPAWAQDPVLLQAWKRQSLIDPDDVFGGVDWSSRMDELFRWKGRQTESQVDWGKDALTVEEEREYARIMGYW